MNLDITKTLLEMYEGVASSPTPKPQDEALAISEYREECRQAYLKAASVLHQFSTENLKPNGRIEPLKIDASEVTFEPGQLLFDDLIKVTGTGAEQIYTLKVEARREALKAIRSREQMFRSLEFNPERIRSDLQVVWEAYLESGTVPDPQTLGYKQLTELCQIAAWLDGSDPGFPTESLLKELVIQKSILGTFEHLVASNFTGREDEIRILQEHIGLKSELTGIAKIRSQLLEWWSTNPPRPFLSIVGLGGIGKSALIGKVLSDQARSKDRIPFAYLAFDQPSLRIENPFTILVEAASQLELQFPKKKRLFDSFQRKVREYRDSVGKIYYRETTSRTRGKRLEDVREATFNLYSTFAKLIEKLGRASRPAKCVLLVLDTFEEVQYRDRESLSGFWEMLAAVQSAYPDFRVIICSRAPVSGSEISSSHITEMKLAELAIEDRVKLLAGLGVANETLARAIANQVGGNPLTLRLAANVVRNDLGAITEQGISDLSTHRWLLFQVEEKIVQGQLYRRILDHIHSEEVKKLAHPGMVLRRIDPEVILELLAPFCHIALANYADAELLFDELKREHALVRSSNDGFLEYRPEVRISVLELLKQDSFGDVRDLHLAAIEYYRTKDDPISRGEEIYHRLVVGEEDNLLLDRRWMTGIEQSIAKSLDEYSDQSKAWLASRMNLEVPREVFANADLAEWERNITRKVVRALGNLDTAGAFSLLRERSERTPASPLFALEAKACLLTDDPDAARPVLLRGIDSLSRSRNRGRLAELYWLFAQLELLESDPMGADAYLADAEKAVTNASNPIPVMQILCHRLLLRESTGLKFEEDSTILLGRLNAACLRLEEEEVRSALYVIEFSIKFLANGFPDSVERLGSLVGSAKRERDFSFELLTSDNLKGLEDYMEPWELTRTGGEESLA